MSFFEDLKGSLFGDPTMVERPTATAKLSQKVQGQEGLGNISADNLQALRGIAHTQRMGTERNDGAVHAGKAGAEFWQSTRQNLPGMRNMTNGANLGAELGSAHSAMTNVGLGQGLAERAQRTGAYHDASNRGEQLASSARQFNAGIANAQDMQGAELGEARARHDATIKESERAGALSATLGAAAGAVNGFKFTNQLSKGIAQMKDEGKSLLTSMKERGASNRKALSEGLGVLAPWNWSREAAKVATPTPTPKPLAKTTPRGIGASSYADARGY
jgi:hypothetical protein